MKTILTFSVVLLASTSSLVAEEAKTLLRDGIFAEEAKKDHQTAIQKYELLLKQFKEDRKIVVVALYRLAEIQRKEGKKKQAAKLYYRLLEEFPNMEPHTTMSRKKLIALGEKLPEKKTAPFDEEEKELARLKKIEITSPDLFRDPRNIENAAKNNWLRVINYLVKKGTDVNQSGALFNAVDFGHLTACKILLDAGCDPNSKKNSKALEFAFQSGYTEIMKLLIKSGADLKGENGNWVPANTDEDTLLSNINIVIKGGYNIDTISPDLNTHFTGKGGGLIHQAAIFNRIDLLDFLLKKNANIKRTHK